MTQMQQNPVMQSVSESATPTALLEQPHEWMPFSRCGHLELLAYNF